MVACITNVNGPVAINTDACWVKEFGSRAATVSKARVRSTCYGGDDTGRSDLTNILGIHNNEVAIGCKCNAVGVFKGGSSAGSIV